jgi:uncharacterized protein YndB with AHSA1/START domain
MAMTSGTATVTLPTDEQILITREFDAPPHLVYKAWTTPDLVRRWWSGGRGDLSVVEIDLRVGGAWRYVFTTESGFEVGFHGEYREIVPDARLVATEVYEGAEAPPGVEPPVNTTEFTDTGDGRTLLTLLTDCHTKEVRDLIVQSGFESGMQDQMDLVEEIARSLAT